MPTTIRDVARVAGVGLGTVSRVINNSPQVSESTRRRVLDAIEALDFHPSPIARRLSLGKTLTIAAVAPFFTRPATVERLRGVEIAIAGTEYDLIVFNVESPERRYATLREVTCSQRVDGALVISLPPSEQELEILQSSSVPVVLIDINSPEVNGFSRVVIDDVAGGRLATEHLIGLGHRRIGYISDSFDEPSLYTASRMRYLGYREALRKAGIVPAEAWHRHGAHGRYEAEQLALHILNLGDPPTAIFAASDTQAIGVMEAARKMGMNVPRDLSVVGYDDIELAEHMGLTTIRQPLFESGAEGVRLLLQVIADQAAAPETIRLPTELVKRRTTARPPNGGSL